mmetsp:Transcript_29389/g.94325  ORF Transcript_29389/g.94325 Transcript_29389/m.94325 type:complete len:238 (-) Transcript_29389:209-922(-)
MQSFLHPVKRSILSDNQRSWRTPNRMAILSSSSRISTSSSSLLAPTPMLFARMVAMALRACSPCSMASCNSPGMLLKIRRRVVSGYPCSHDLRMAPMLMRRVLAERWSRARLQLPSSSKAMNRLSKVRSSGFCCGGEEREFCMRHSYSFPRKIQEVQGRTLSHFTFRSLQSLHAEFLPTRLVPVLLFSFTSILSSFAILTFILCTKSNESGLPHTTISAPCRSAQPARSAQAQSSSP